MSRLVRIFAAMSEVVNAGIGGHNNETVSGRAWRLRTKPKWKTAYKLLNGVFFWQNNHCYTSHLDDVIWHDEFAQMIKGNDYGK